MFALRITDSSAASSTPFPVHPCPTVLVKCNELRQLVHGDSNKSDIWTAIHELILALLDSDRQSWDCITSKFLVLSGFDSPVKRLCTLDLICNTLSGLKWTFRSTTFWEILEQVKKSDGADKLRQVLRFSTLFLGQHDIFLIQ